MGAAQLDSGLPAIAARNVAKTFRLPEERVHTLKERALHPLKRIHYHTFPVLQDISFAVGRGEFFGITGRNGSGKSTLLKCMAGIYACDGDIWCRGRLSTFIELGVGFNLDLPALDNVVINGIMMGLSPKEARKRFETVIDFAELHEFKDLKLKNYSSGMQVRLAFSVAIQVDADILLIDEVLAVGDAAFQQKCFDVFTRMREQGKTIVFVTHDMGAMRRFCDRAMLLERGSSLHIGEPRDVADKYLEVNFGRDAEAVGESGGRPGDGEARVREVWVEDMAGRRLPAIPQGQRATLRVHVDFLRDVADPSARVDVLDEEHKVVFVAGTLPGLADTGRFRAGEQAVFSFTFDNLLGGGRYSPIVSLAHRGEGLDLIDRFDRGFSFLVTATQERRAAVELPVEVSIERVGPLVEQQVSA
jgi:ABC-type polysaccharide/polyol phosphate transport system ATPase subunit